MQSINTNKLSIFNENTCLNPFPDEEDPSVFDEKVSFAYHPSNNKDHKDSAIIFNDITSLKSLDNLASNPNSVKDILDASNDTPNLVSNIKETLSTIRYILTLESLIYKIVPDTHTIYYDLEKLFMQLRQLYQEYYEVLNLLKPDEEMDVAQENLSVLNSTPKIIPANSWKDLCFPILDICVDFLKNNIFQELANVLLSIIAKNALLQSDMNNLRIIISKLDAVRAYFPMAATFNKNDIFAQPNNNKIWDPLKEKAEIKQLDSPNKLRESLERFVSELYLTNAMISTSDWTTTKILKDVLLAFGAFYYFFMGSKAKIVTQMAYADKNNKNAIRVWNFTEKKFIKGMLSLVLPSIAVSKKIYITRQYPEITLEAIDNEIKTNTLHKITPIKFCPAKNSIGILEKIPDKIQIRILSAKDLPYIKEGIGDEIRTINSYKANWFSCGTIFKRKLTVNDSYFDGIAIHIHGGGFISMSSSSHQSYTRQWAKIAQKPIFSIDYRLAPENQFPAALDDCWQAYNWIIDNAEETFGIKTKKIILVGDSAGGNLALGVTLRAIKLGFRVPDGLLLAYPALNMSEKVFTPSILLSVDDQIIPYSLLKFCLECYVPSGMIPEINPYICGIVTPDEFIKKLPPIRMVVGTLDPLHDDCWRFLYRLNKFKKNVKLTVYRQMPHGFLSYDIPRGMKQSKQTIKDTGLILKELFELEKLPLKRSSSGFARFFGH